MRKKRTFLLIVVATALLFAVGSAYAGTISVVGPSLVPTTGQFTIDILIDDISPLTDLDFWQLGLQLNPATTATFVSASNLNSNSDYVFFGDADDYLIAVLNPYQITLGSNTLSGGGVTDVVGKLLASVLIDVSGANPGDLFSLALFDSGNTFFGSSEFDIDLDIAFLQGYEFQAVPIPGTVLLFGSGLAGLAALRRRRQLA